MKLIRLHPNYHGYALDDPVFVKLLESAIRERLGVQIVAQMEDERTQHPLMQVKPVDFKPLPALLKSLPEARVMVLNASRAMSMTALAGSGVWLDIAMLEGLGGVGNLLKDWPRDRVVFGSNAPLFYWESARLKLQESELSASQMTAITSANAGAFLAR
jgi:predicted TIM-barrel fold metal-dependent hydrolase